MASTNVLTNSLDRIEAAKWIKTQKWIYDRILFIMSVRDECPDYYQPQLKITATADEIHATWQKSLSYELYELKKTYPEIYTKAEVEASWKYLNLL